MGTLFPLQCPVAAPSQAPAEAVNPAHPPNKADALNASYTQVLRATACDRIRQAISAKLILVRAPAGYGKTTAMQQARICLEEEGVATAWLTLDRSDNDVSRFLKGLSDAVARLTTETDDDRAQADVLNVLADHSSPFALFLDDFECIQEQAVLGLVREMLDRLPRRGQIVIGSRSLPDLGLGRLRARGQLTEIDAEHLRFTLEETRLFFQLRKLTNLPAAAITQLHEKTEGWVAALWLASMALERRGQSADFIERFSGSNRAIADYLAEDVLSRQSEDVRSFLLRTSVLRQLHAPLCQALNPRLDCARILEQLDTANLFLNPIHDGPSTLPSWRYHSLFADFLRNQLMREQPEECSRLHLAASAWYESNGHPVQAIDHAIEGGDFPHALTLLTPWADQFLANGRLRLLSRWFALIPKESLRANPRLMAVSVWTICFTQGPWQAMPQLEQALLVGGQDADVRANIRALHPLLLAMMDRYEEAYRIGRESLAELPSGKPFADSVLTNAMANVASVMGHHHEAHRLLDSARSTQGTSTFVRIYTESMEGLLDLQEGRLRQATARFRLAATGEHKTGYNHTNGHAWAGVFYAAVVYETNQLDEAEHLLNIYLPLARDVGLPDHMILSHVLRSRIAFHRGDIDAAFHVLTELEYLGHHRQLPRVVASAKLERARMLLLQGHAQVSRDELDRANDQALWSRVSRQRLPAQELEDLQLGRLRWEITFGDPARALLSAHEDIQDALERTRHGRVLKLRVLKALALQRSGNLPAAMDTLLDVLHQTCQEGFMQLILDEGQAAAALLHRCYAHLQGEPTGRRQLTDDPIFHEHLQRLIKAAGPAPAMEGESVIKPGEALSEPLTRKEIRVLQLLAEGYSNSAMAEKLFVSDSTVRTHLRNINMKLGAHSRTQAVAIARKLAVIR